MENVEDINDYVPSLLNPRGLRRDDNNCLTQVSNRSRLSLSLKKNNTKDSSILKRPKRKVNPLTDNNNEINNQTKKDPYNSLCGILDKENMIYKDHSQIAESHLCMTTKKHIFSNNLKKVQNYSNSDSDNFEFNKTQKTIQSSKFKSKSNGVKNKKNKPKSVCRQQRNKLIESKEMTDKCAKVNIKMAVNSSKELTLDTDSNTVITRLSVTNKDNIMHVDCFLENNLITLSDSDDDSPKTQNSKCPPGKVPFNGKVNVKVCKSKDRNWPIWQSPKLRKSVILTAKKRQAKHSSSEMKIKTPRRNAQQKTKNNSKSLLDSSCSSNRSSLKQSTLLSFLCSKVTPDKSNIACNETNNESECSTVLINTSKCNDVDNDYCLSIENTKRQILHSPTVSFLKDNESEVDSDFPVPICIIHENDLTSTPIPPEAHDKTNVSPSSNFDATSPRPTSSLGSMLDHSIYSTPLKNINATKTTYPQMVRRKKEVPSYKIVKGTPFAVDAFCYGNLPNILIYFLTHFHSDHYIGLRKSFNRPLFCTKITAELCKMKLGINSKIINILELDQTITLNGIEVTAVDANHCPGAVMLIFSLPNGENILHCGDFRANDLMESYPILWTKDIETIYLDTTYCNPRYDFPTQEESIWKAIDILREKKVRMDTCGLDFKRVLIACGTYFIGKEKFFKGIAEELGCNIWANPEKNKVLNIVEGRSFNAIPPNMCQLHVLSIMQLNFEALSSHLQSFSTSFDEIVAFRPSGWQTNRSTHNRRGNVTLIGIPYSEHSSYSELKRFVRFLRPKTVIPTVPLGKQDLQKHIYSWLNDKQNVQTRVSDFFTALRKA